MTAAQVEGKLAKKKRKAAEAAEDGEQGWQDEEWLGEEQYWEEEAPAKKKRTKGKKAARAAAEQPEEDEPGDVAPVAEDNVDPQQEPDSATAAELPDGEDKEGEEEQNDDDPQSAPAKPSSRRTKREIKAEALEPGAVVIYWEEYRGIIRDSFAPLDEFWVADEKSGQIVRDEEENIVSFTAAELVPVATAPKPKHLLVGAAGAEGPKVVSGKVLVIGPESCMVKVLEHFGEPDDERRQTPQQLLAIPCGMCDPTQLQSAACEGVDPRVKALAESLRPDIHVAVRAFHLKRLMAQLAPDVLNLDGFYCLASVHVPYSRQEVLASTSKRERKFREDAWCQIDLCTTALGEYEDETSVEAVAKRALGEHCGVQIEERLWTDEAQLAMRNRLGLPYLPFRLKDDDGVEVYVIMLPKDAEFEKSGPGVLCFSEARAAPEAPAAKESSRTSTSRPGAHVEEPAEKDDNIAERMGLGGRELPPGWQRVQSKSTGKVYFYNRLTNQSTFEFPEAPLPRGWQKLFSKSTGKPYYFNAGRQMSQYERPTK